MGDVLMAGLFVLALFAAIAGTVVYVGSSSQRRKRMNNAPAVLLPPGENPDVLIANARKSYALLQRAVRVLDRLQPNDEAVDGHAWKEIRSIVSDFYDL